MKCPASIFATLLHILLAFLPAQTHGQIRGVNLGGWLVTEQWITPSLYDSTPANDEWHLCEYLGAQACLSTLRSHWDSFYTRADLAAIRAAGLNTLRIPVGYWAVDAQPALEPYVSGQYPYLIRAVQWAQQLGLAVVLDLHGAPGSQNGQDNSGLIGPVLFAANASNADRSARVLRNLTEEFSRTEVYGTTVVGIELLNEPRLSPGVFDTNQLKEFYAQGSDVVAGVVSGINVTVHDAFYGPEYWADYNPSSNASYASQPAQQLTLDTHQYYAFAPLNNLPQTTILQSVCNLSQLLKQPRSSSGIPPTIVGEWSLETGMAPTSQDQHNQDAQARRTWFRLFFEAQHAAYSPSGPGQSSLGWIFWAWKTEYDIDTWSYRNGIAEEYIPADISNASQLVFPLLENGCVDASFNYTAPRNVGASSGKIEVSWILLVSMMAVGSAVAW